jgi:hypothetical protein
MMNILTNMMWFMQPYCLFEMKWKNLYKHDQQEVIRIKSRTSIHSLILINQF